MNTPKNNTEDWKLKYEEAQDTCCPKNQINNLNDQLLVLKK
jgi:hypothetical protein